MGTRRRSATTSAECPKEGWGGKALAGVIGLVCGVLGGVLGTAVSPAGESLREAWSPTVAVVSGSVVKHGAGIEARVQLDGSGAAAPHTFDDTDDWGGFGFAGVARGPHAVSILEGGDTIAYQREFTIGVGERTKELGVMDLASAQPRLRPDAVPAAGPTPTAGVPAVAIEETLIAAIPATSQPPEPDFELSDEWIEGTVWASAIEPTFAAPPETMGTPEAGSEAPAYEIVVESAPLPPGSDLGGLPPGARRVSVYVAGAMADLALVDRVTYTLPASFNPNIVTRYDPGDGFRLAFDSGPTTVSATVYFPDGSSLEQTIEIGVP